MGLSGAGFGAARSLEEIVIQQRLQQALQAEITNRERQFAEQQRSNRADEQYRRDTLGQRDKEFTAQQDRQAGQDRDRNNQLGIRRMMGDFITQKEGPFTPEDQRGIAGLQVEAGQVPNIDIEKPPVPKKYQVTTPGPDGRPISKLVDEGAMEQGVPVYREPKAGPAPEPDQVWVVRGGTLTPIRKGTAQHGDQPYDAVSARKTPSQPEAVDTAQEVRRIATALKASPGMKGAFGLIESKLPTFRQSTADSEVLRNSLMSMLTLENMDKMKGVLSDSDMKVVRQASTTLAAEMSDPAAAAELDRLIQVMGKVTGETPTPAPSHAPSGPAGPAAAPTRLRFDAQGNPIK